MIMLDGCTAFHDHYGFTSVEAAHLTLGGCNALNTKRVSWFQGVEARAKRE